MTLLALVVVVWCTLGVLALLAMVPLCRAGLREDNARDLQLLAAPGSSWSPSA